MCLIMVVAMAPFSLTGMQALESLERVQSFGYAVNENYERKGIRLEDTYHVEITPQYAFFGLYDGHLGRKVADYAAEYLHTNCDLANRKSADEIAKGLTQGFIKTNNDLPEYGQTQGSTATVAVVRGDLLVVANAGDSRTVLCRKGKAVALTQDHTPMHRADEIKRVKNAYDSNPKPERWPTWDDFEKFFLKLALSRTLGDKQFNPYSIPDPEIQSTRLTTQDAFLILASDGVWDVMNNQNAVDVVQHQLQKKPHDFQMAAQVLVQDAIDKGSKDHVSAIVVDLKAKKNEQENQTPESKGFLDYLYSFFGFK
jgi:protein phosphatase 1L